MTLWYTDNSDNATYTINEDTMLWTGGTQALSKKTFVPDGVIYGESEFIDNKDIWLAESFTSNALFGENYSTLNHDFKITTASYLSAGVAVYNNIGYVVDATNSQLHTYNITTGLLLNTYYSFGSGLTNLNGPGICITDGTKLYITDTNNSRIFIVPLSNLAGGATSTISILSHYATGTVPRAVTIDLTSIYVTYEDLTADHSRYETWVSVFNRTTLVRTADVLVFYPGAGGDYVAFGLTVDNSFVYAAIGGASGVFGIYKYTKAIALVTTLSFNVSNPNHWALFSDRWWGMMFPPSYVQISGGASGKRFKPYHSLYTPYQDTTYP